MTRILVVGPGALGIPTAVRLHNAGHDVVVAVRDQAKADLLHAQGFHLTAPDGTKESAQIPCIHDPADAGQPFDLLIHTTKCHGAERVLEHWLPALSEQGLVIPFQNGLMADTFLPVAGARFVECSVYWPATLTEPGHSHMTGDGHNVLGPWPAGAPSTAHEDAAKTLSAVVHTDTHPDMRAVKWSKLALNSAMTGLGVATGATMREMMGHAPTRKAFLAILREGLAVMKAQGIQPVAIGSSKPALLSRMPDVIADVVLRLLARKYGDYRSSSAQSLARGEPTEIDFLNGVIVAAGAAHDVPTPINAALVETVHAIESGANQGQSAVEEMMTRA